MPSPMPSFMPSTSHENPRRLRDGKAAVGVLSAAALVAALLGACSSDDSAAPATGDGGTGDSATTAVYSTAAAEPGPDNGHCTGVTPQAVSQAACHVEPTVPEAGADAGGTDAAADDDAMPDELPGQAGSEGDDDDCKYHVKWESTPVTTAGPVSIRATVTSKVDGTPVTGAGPYLEVFLNNTPASSQGGDAATGKGVESPAGVYTFDNVKFGQAGRWTFRVHIWGSCDDGDESPHGHAAFLINVP